MKKIEINISNNILERLDLYLSKEISDLSRSEIKKLIQNGNILVNGSILKPKYLLNAGDQIIIEIPQAQSREILAQDIPLNVIYEDLDIAIIDKPQGMVVHPAPGIYSDTLVNALLYRFESLSKIGGEMRPGIVHRLDKDTSGLLIIAKNDLAHISLSQRLKDRDMKREYIALVKGVVTQDEGIIDEPIGRNPRNRKKMAVIYENSKDAITYYKVEERFQKHTLLRMNLETGRTHQIRVHLAYMNHPIVGDPTYAHNDKFNLKGQLLHSIKVGFIHPTSEKYMEFSTDLPKRFSDIIKKIK
nr:RluA family pseudouridine synthase [Tissierella sp.]